MQSLESKTAQVQVQVTRIVSVSTELVKKICFLSSCLEHPFKATECVPGRECCQVLKLYRDLEEVQGKHAHQRRRRLVIRLTNNVPLDIGLDELRDSLGGFSLLIYHPRLP